MKTWREVFADSFSPPNAEGAEGNRDHPQLAQKLNSDLDKATTVWAREPPKAMVGGCLMGVCLTGVHLTGIHFIGMHLIGVYLICVIS